MNKNSILAVVLSGILLFAWVFVQSKYFTPKPQVTPVEQTVAGNENSTENAEIKDESNVEMSEAPAEKAEDVVESNYVITTNKLKVTFTNRGGDITSLQLLEHKDNKTNDYIQMAENISAYNRAFAVNFGSEDKQIVNDLFTVKEFEKESNGMQKIAFIKKYDGYTFIKQYSFMPDDYMFKINILVDGADGFKGLSFDGKDGKISYSIRTSPQIGPYYDKKTDRYENRTFIAHNSTKTKKITLQDKQNKKYEKEFNWAGIAGKYFCEIVIPENPGVIKDIYYNSMNTGFELANAQSLFERKEISDKRTNDVFYVYAGPRSEKYLKNYSEAKLNGWGFEGKRLTDGIQTYQFLGWLEVIFKWMMQMIYKLIPNWGVSIIIMTIILKIILFPLTLKSSVGTLKMQEIQPRMTAIQNKYKDNPQKLQEETAKLYQETGYNPMSGCLPMIFQMLALFAMFDLFNNYFEFRGAGFVKGWIDDLSVGDSIWSWNKNIPFISGFTGNHLRILPIIYLFSQLLYGKITQSATAATAGQNAGTMKFMTYGLPIIFSFMFYNAPSGLILFWTISNIIQFGQQAIINKVMAKKKAEKENSSSVTKFPKKSNKRGK